MSTNGSRRNRAGGGRGDGGARSWRRDGTGRIPLWLKIGFTVWVLIWIPVYWEFYGPRNFMWFCDIGNVVLAAAQ